MLLNNKIHFGSCKIPGTRSPFQDFTNLSPYDDLQKEYPRIAYCSKPFSGLSNIVA